MTTFPRGCLQHACILLLMNAVTAWVVPPLTMIPLSRSNFLSNLLVSPLPLLSSSGQKGREDLVLPLKFLPNGGSWALRITLTDQDFNDFSYYGIVDTGSPFLTSPSMAMDRTMPTKYPTTIEQYGESTGGVTWRKASYMGLSSGRQQLLEKRNMVLGIASPEVIQETGGIFVGLIRRDDNRPSFLQQVGYRSLAIDFQSPSILLSNRRLIEPQDPDSLKLFSLQPYGPDLYHYGVECDGLELYWKDERRNDNQDEKRKDQGNGIRKESISKLALKRPLIAVLDTGLTGCIVSDSLQQELEIFKEEEKSPSSLTGVTVRLPTTGGTTVELASLDKYWRVSSFRLPWFYDDEQHPHIIALGSTFWAHTDSLVIDTSTQRAKILQSSNNDP